MKHTIVAISLLISTLGFSQVIIGDDVGTAPVADKTSVLLEFANDGHKGIILPYVKTLPTQEGAIYLDVSNPANARVKYNNGGSQPFDLSGDGAIVSTASSGTSINTNSVITGVLAQQPSGRTNDDTGKAIIGADTSSADGVLVLESTTKAMVLPYVNSTDDVLNPSPGMMVYITKSDKKRLAVFNGSKWSYWKP